MPRLINPARIVPQLSARFSVKKHQPTAQKRCKKIISHHFGAIFIETEPLRTTHHPAALCPDAA
jgi:hypothetical protein